MDFDVIAAAPDVATAAVTELKTNLLSRNGRRHGNIRGTVVSCIETNKSRTHVDFRKV